MGEVDMQEEITAFTLRQKKDPIWPAGFDEDDNLGLRVHRAISWIERAEQEADDADAAFVFYWIAFNSAYPEPTEQCGGSGTGDKGHGGAIVR